jgi:group I intron endonuclease
MIGIYKIDNPLGKSYIGQSIKIETRFSRYKNLKCKDQPKIYNSLVKYGAENHVFSVLLECTQNELNDKEIYYIEKYDTVKKGLNIKQGGHSGLHSVETKEKMSKKAIGNKYGNGNKNREGIKWSDEFREKMIPIRKTQNIGNKLSQETKEKISIANKGNKKRLGAILTDKQKLNIKLGHKEYAKSIICKETGQIYFSIRECSKLMNIDRKSICNILKSLQLKSKGYSFEYARL